MMNASSSPNASYNSVECLTALSFVFDPQANVIRSIQILLVFIFVALLIRLIREYFMATIIFHGNFLLLFSNIVLVYLIYACACFLHEFRYLVWLAAFCGPVFLRTKWFGVDGGKIELLNFIIVPFNLSPCSSMIPIWWSAIVRGPQYFECVFMPLIHFTLMLERVRATLFMDKYEREGRHFGLISLLTIWLLSILFFLFIFLTMLMDNGWDLNKQLAFTSLISLNYNNWAVVSILYAILPIIFVTILADLLIVFQNKKAQKQKINSLRYNLSRIYQINENILTMNGLILPLDFCFFSLFLIYFSLTIYIRSIQMSKINLQIGHDWINSIMLLHGIITVFLYTKFLINSRKRRKRAPEIKPTEQQMEAYFRELRKQWNK